MSIKTFSAEFKSKIVLEALQKRSTLSELSKRHEVHPNLIVQCKKSLLENGFKVFQRAILSDVVFEKTDHRFGA